VRELTIPAPHVRSLTWHDDVLVDWVCGGTVFDLEGRTQPSTRHFAYDFDAALSSPSGDYAIVYTRLGTKGLIVDTRAGDVVREIDRSYYHASTYEYPIAIGRRSGREILIHCPDQYCRLEIEDLRTGEFLTDDVPRDPPDYFYSRLAINPSGTLLLTAGWVWHPLDVVTLHSIDTALSGPRELDTEERSPRTRAEVTSAAFLDDTRVVVVTTRDPLEEEEDPWDPTSLEHGCVGVWDTTSGEYTAAVRTEEKVGTVWPVSDTHVMGFFEHPRLFDLATGRVVREWPDLPTGRQESSILRSIGPVPPIAIDAAKRRVAVATEREIRVISFD